MRIIVNMKEIKGKIGMEARIYAGCRDSALERLAGEALFRHLREVFNKLEETAAVSSRWARVKAFFGRK